jgi:predicted phosphate transport protein (TIGR00153 family)
VRLPGSSKKNLFYELLEQQADSAVRAALVFQELINDFTNLAHHAEKIKEIETAADQINHDLANLIDSTFVTPLDKEDLHALSSELDDVTDSIEACSGRMALYQFTHTQVRPDMELLVSLLVRITEATLDAIKALRTRPSREGMQDIFIHIHQIEKEHDAAFRRALANLLNAPDADPIKVIKWKQIYDRLELAVDRCEDVAHIIESVVIKYA